MQLKKLLLPLLILFGCAPASSAAEVVNVPLFPDKSSYNIRPRMPAAHALPVCVYADGILTIGFSSPEGDADIVITHSDYTEEYALSTESTIIIYTDIAVGDSVKITTEEGNCYVAVCEE